MSKSDRRILMAGWYCILRGCEEYVKKALEGEAKLKYFQHMRKRSLLLMAQR